MKALRESGYSKIWDSSYSSLYNSGEFSITVYLDNYLKERFAAARIVNTIKKEFDDAEYTRDTKGQSNNPCFSLRIVFRHEQFSDMSKLKKIKHSSAILKILSESWQQDEYLASKHVSISISDEKTGFLRDVLKSKHLSQASDLRVLEIICKAMAGRNYDKEPFSTELANVSLYRYLDSKKGQIPICTRGDALQLVNSVSQNDHISINFSTLFSVSNWFISKDIPMLSFLYSRKTIESINRWNGQISELKRNKYLDKKFTTLEKDGGMIHIVSKFEKATIDILYQANQRESVYESLLDYENNPVLTDIGEDLGTDLIGLISQFAGIET